ncbi:MAG: HlyC/CorC family transporter [Pseudomonadales bacterium]
MNDNSNNDENEDKSWLEKLGHVFQSSPKTRGDLLDVLNEAQQNDLIDREVYGMIEGAMEVSDKQARDILVPAAQMVMVSVDETAVDFMPKIIKSAHSRFPVIGDNKDDVLGILLAKDLLPHVLKGAGEELNLRDLLRPVTFIPESKRLNVLLREFRETRTHMAIVLDEYGDVEGLVTIEDVLEEIVGEIEDEHDTQPDSFIRKISDADYLIKALTPIDAFNRQFKADFSESEFDTIGGILMQQFGYLPKRNELITIGDFRFRIINADSRQIHLLRMSVVDS